MSFKVRSLILGLLSVMVLGAIASAPALAEPGPWWHHRAEGGSGNGLKIEKQAPQAFEGEGTGTELTAKVGGTEFKIKCNIKAKGKIWNEPAQGQGEVAVIYEKCLSNNIEGCTVGVVSSGNYIIHLLWKYAENAKELENKKQQKEQGQHWDAILLPLGVNIEPNAAGTEQILKEKASFAEVKFGSTCGVIKGLSGKANGSTGFTASLEEGQFTKKVTLKFPGSILKQHEWVQKLAKFLPIKLELLFAGNEGKFSGELPITFSGQEVAVFET